MSIVTGPSLAAQSLYLMTLIAGLTLSLALAVIAFQRRDRLGAKPFLGMTLAGSEAMLMYVVLSLTRSQDIGYVAARLRFAGLELGALFVFLFAAEFTGIHRLINRRLTTLLLIVPLVTQLLLWVGSGSRFFFAEWSFTTYDIISVDHARFMGWYWIHAAYIFGLDFLAVAFVVRYVRWSTGPQRNQGLVLLIGAAFSFLLLLLNTLLNNLPLNLTPISILLSVVSLSWAVFRQQILDVIPVAYDRVFRGMHDGVIVLNNRNLVVQMNPAAESILNRPSQLCIGNNINDLLTEDLAQNLITKADTQFDATIPLNRIERFYKIHISLLSDANAAVLGRVIVLYDVTEQKRTERELLRQNQYLATLQQISLDLFRNHEPDALLQAIVERAAVILDAPYSELMLKQDEALVVQTFTSNQPYLQGDRISRNEGGLSWQAYDSKQPAILDNYSAWPHHRAVYNHIELYAVADFPILVGQECLGVLGMGRSKPHNPFTAEDIQKGLLFSQLAAVVLNNANLYNAALREITERKEIEAVLKDSEYRYRQLLENAPVALAVIELATGNVLYVNPAAQGIFPDTAFSDSDRSNASSDEFRRWMNLLALDIRQKLEDGLGQGNQLAQNTSLPLTEYTLNGPDGTLIYLVIRSALTEYDRRRAVLVAMNNISETKIALQAESEQRRFTEALLDIATTVNSTLRFQEVMDRVFHSLTDVMGYDWINIMLIEGEFARVTEARGYAAEDLATIQQTKFLVSDTPTLRQMVETHEPIIIDDIETYPAWKMAGTVPKSRSYLGAPIIAGTNVLGFINLDSKHRQIFNTQDARRLKTFSAQIAVAMMNAQAYEHAQEDAAEAERQRLARELHDAVSQTLFSASVTAEALSYALDSDPAFVRQGLEQLVKLTRGALSEMRTLLVELRPSALQETDLNILLTHLVNSLKTRTTAAVDYRVEGEPISLPMDSKIALYRIAQEAINNAIKHSHAHHIEILLDYRSDVVALHVSDDGIGFVLESVDSQHLGIHIMQERATLTGIAFAIQNVNDHGTMVTAKWEGVNSG